MKTHFGAIAWLLAGTDAVTAAPIFSPTALDRAVTWQLAKPVFQLRTGTLPNSFALDGNIAEWQQAQNNFHLQTRQGDLLWLASNDNGLYLAGLRSNKNTRVRLQISTQAKLKLPPIGWPGVALTGASDCNDPALREDLWEVNADVCKEFYQSQVTFQTAIRAAFAPSYWISDAGLDWSAPLQFAATDPAMAFLPKAKAQFAMHNEHDVQSFELFWPWDALPPTNQQNLDRVYLRAESCTLASNGCRAFMPSYARPNVEDSNADVAVLLAHSMQYQLTTCDLPLWSAQSNTLSDGFFMPGKDLVLKRSLALAVSRDEYCARGPNSNFRLPEPGVFEFNQQEIGPNEFICGPLTSYRSAKGLQFAQKKYTSLRTANTNNDRELDLGIPTDESNDLLVRKLDLRYALVIEPPIGKARTDRMRHCGGDTSVSMRAWLLDRQMAKFTPLLDWRGYPQECWGQGQSFDVSQDLFRITHTQYDTEKTPEQRVISHYCFDQSKLRYVACKK